MFFDQDNHANCWLYTDGGSGRGDNRKFAFETATGGYYLRDAAKTVYVKHDGNVLTVPATSEGEATVWTLKTKSEHDAIVAAYVNENKSSVISAAGISTTPAEFESYLAENLAAKDVTSSVPTYNFEANANGSWTWTETGNRSGGAVNYADKVAEVYQHGGYFTQIVENLKPGIYKVSVNAFERDGSYANCNTLGAVGYEIVTSYFEANGQKVQLKSWYSDKEETNNPDSRSQAYTAFNNDKYLNEVYAYVSGEGEEAGKLTLKVVKPSYTSGSWVLFNNIKLTYYDSEIDETAATAILDETSTQMEKPMKHSLYDALNTAKETFDGARTVPNYNALRLAIDNTNTSVASYANMYNNYLSVLNTYFTTTNFVQSDAYNTYLGYKAAYEDYKEDGCADVENATANALGITKGNGTNYTSTYSQLMLPNWKIGSTAALTNGSGFYVNTWSNESAGEGEAKDFENPFFEYWTDSKNVSLAANTITGTLTGLTPNKAYDVTANVRVQGTTEKVSGSITMEVAGGVAVDVTTGTQIGTEPRYIKSYTATGVTDAEGKLELKFTVAANSNISWLSFRDVNYAESNATISNDFSVLESAINTVESNHVLGFEKEEYAPYTNHAGVEAIATAKAFDKTRYYIPTVITAAATAVGNATWTQNSEEKNAIYWDYSTMASTEKSKAYGWYDPALSGNVEGSMYSTRVFNHLSSNPGLAAVDNNVALFTKISTNYGKEAGYTLPLKANRTYKLSFKFAGWTEPSESTISITDENGENPINISGVITVSGVKIEGGADDEMPSNGNKYASVWADYEGYFTVPADGNYILNINRINMGNNVQRQLVMGNIDLRTAEALEFVDGAVPTYAPGTYPAVKISRTLTENRWATAVYPFAVSGVDNIVELTGYDAATGKLKFSTVDNSTANKPFLMKSNSAKSEISLSNVAVAAAAPVDVTFDGLSLKGVYAQTTIKNETDDNVYYAVSNNVISPVSEATVPAYRAYIKMTAAHARNLTFVVDDETTTAIEGLSVEHCENGNFYNLNGQRVNKARKGLYIVNGKKVVMK